MFFSFHEINTGGGGGETMRCLFNDGGEQESFELVGGSFLRTKLARSGGTKPTFKAAKTIHPKSKQSRGNPKPIPKELHSKTIHVLAPSQTTARIRSRCRFHWMPKLVEDFRGRSCILLNQESRNQPKGFHRDSFTLCMNEFLLSIDYESCAFIYFQNQSIFLNQSIFKFLLNVMCYK